MSMTTIEPAGNLSETMKLPDLSLPSTQGEFSLQKELLGHRSVLAFYPKDASSVCANELGIFNEALPLFNRRYNTKIVGISTDSLESHEKFAVSLNLRFPLLADDDPIGRLTKIFGVYDAENKRPQRALFLFDEQGDLYWYQIYPDNVNPGADGILRALDQLEEK